MKNRTQPHPCALLLLLLLHHQPPLRSADHPRFRLCCAGRLVNGTRDLLRQQSGLAHHANYHEFCRLLGRLKANYQLSELVRRALGWAGVDYAPYVLSWPRAVPGCSELSSSLGLRGG